MLLLLHTILLLFRALCDLYVSSTFARNQKWDLILFKKCLQNVHLVIFHLEGKEMPTS